MGGTVSRSGDHQAAHQQHQLNHGSHHQNHAHHHHNQQQQQHAYQPQHHQHQQPPHHQHLHQHQQQQHQHLQHQSPHAHQQQHHHHHVSAADQPNAMADNRYASNVVASHALDRDNPSTSLNNFTITEFQWNFGGHSVFIMGGWDDWRIKTPLSPTSHNAFTVVLALPTGTFQYKFIVDGNWKHNPALPTQVDPNGNLNNVVVVVPQVLEYDSDPLTTSADDPQPRSPVDSYNFSIFPQEDHAAEPPLLPRMLAGAPLDCDRRCPPADPASGTDFVRLNHMFSTSSAFAYGRDAEILTLASEVRYKSKVVTTILITSTRAVHQAFRAAPNNAVQSAEVCNDNVNNNNSENNHARFDESQSLILDALNNV